MRIKWILILIIGGFLVSLTPNTANACEIDFEITKSKKDIYQVGDTLVVLVKVVLTHRSCPIAMQKTTFKMNGFKVLKSTKWKQIAAMDWERKLMMVVTETKGKGKGKGKGNQLNITAIRECDKDGGFGSLKLEVIQ